MQCKKAMLKEAERFLILHKADWKDTISSKVLTALKLKRQEGREKLPTSEDLSKLKDHMEGTMRQLIDDLTSLFSCNTYRKLLEYALASVLLFNKRRGGETSKLLTTQYVKRNKWKSNANKGLIKTLSACEKKLVER